MYKMYRASGHMTSENFWLLDEVQDFLGSVGDISKSVITSLNITLINVQDSLKLG